MPKKRCDLQSATSRAFAGAARAALAAMLLLALAQSSGAAQALYKWADADGKIHYSDQPPKGFKGEVMRIDADEQPATQPPYQAPRDGARRSEQDAPRTPDLASQKRDQRSKLAAAISVARERYEAAKQALDAAGAPQDDERQVIQQRVDKNSPAPGPGSATTGGMLGMGGMLGGAPRSNCTTVKSASGQQVTTCPTPVPNDAYYDRIAKLEEAVRAAKEELEAAEQAYRRAVD
ncbi:MAG: DUF4124 domain-containing protein [Usitatibacter sp.]